MKYTPVTAWSLRAFLAGFLLAITACTAALTPSHDQELVDGVNAANEQALILFSEVSGGATTGGFAALAPKYDGIIGKFDALRLRAAARDVPALGPRLASTEVVEFRL